MCKTYMVYRHISPNGKMYIGITSLSPNLRWRNGQGYSQQYFAKAIKKYGWENFQHEILLSDLTQQQAECAERIFIGYWDLTNPNKGYNIDNGGNSIGSHSEITRSKISNAKSGANHHFYGKHLSQEHKNKIAITNSLRQMGENNSFYGKKHTNESKQKIKENHYDKSGANHHFYGKHLSIQHKRKLQDNSHKKMVVALDKESNKVMFVCKSIRDAERWSGVAHESISACCKGKLKTSGGYKWKYLE